MPDNTEEREVPLLSASRTIEPESCSLDDVLDTIGTSPRQLAAVAVCGLGNVADATEILSIGYVLPLLHAKESDKALLSGTVFAGMLVGGLVFGCIADHFGRKKTLALAMGLNAGFGILFALSSQVATMPALFGYLVTFRFFAGCGVGGSVPIIFPLAAELVPSRHRGLIIMAGVASMWMVGSIFAAGLAWLMLGKFDFPWHVYMFVTTIPAVLCCLLSFFWLPESPRYLLMHGKEKQAMSMMASFARSAGCSDAVSSRTKIQGGFEQTGQVTASLKDNLLAGLHVVQSLWHPQCRRSFVLLAVVWFAINFGWYGLLLWFPTLFKERGIDNGSVYESTFFVSLANLPGNIVSSLIVDIVGRRVLLVASMVGAACSTVLIIFAKTTLEATLAACVFNGISIGAWNSLDVLSSEAFPTASRATAIGLLAAIGRIGAFIAQQVNGSLVDQSAGIVLAISAAFMGSGSIAAWQLPETKGKHLRDSVAQ